MIKASFFRILFSTVFFLMGSTAVFSFNNENTEDEMSRRPKLVVGIVVDQMRWDYLVRYRDMYGKDGLRRLTDEGCCFDQCLINYIPTVTAAGHASIFTGSVPGLNGIVGNDFYINGKLIYCTDDHSVKGVGTTTAAGEMSPRNLLPTTMTDELRLATNFRSKVIGVSLKDRASILPAGHCANGAFWFDPKVKGFVTSTYYMNELPKWVKDFNARKLVDKYLAQGWKFLYDETQYKQSEARDTLTELHTKGDVRYTPWGNTLTLDIARAALEGEKMGKGEETDFLTINLASTDYVGHSMGPNSIYTEDTYLRLDKDLASFIDYLDKNYGRDNYLLFLTADHGGSHNIVFRERHKLPAMLYEAETLQPQLDSVLCANAGVPAGVKVINSINCFQVQLDDSLISVRSLDRNRIVSELCKYIEGRDDFAYAFDLRNIPDYIPEPLRTMTINGYNPKRSGDIQLIPENGTSQAYKSGARHLKGSNHNVWSPRDAHIPLIFFGYGVKHKHITTPCHITDIAPTVSALLHIQQPSASVGTPLQVEIEK